MTRELKLIQQVRDCKLCTQLPLGPKPIFQFHPEARILIAGQAPGRVTHHKGIPFDDASGDRLRGWLGVDKDTFYSPQKLAILPMAMCYPGTGRSGDIAPPEICAETWRQTLLARLTKVKLTLIVGQYAMNWHLGKVPQKTLTETVENWREYWPEVLPLPHPSPRNNRWLKQNPWFEDDVLPELRDRVKALLQN